MLPLQRPPPPFQFSHALESASSLKPSNLSYSGIPTRSYSLASWGLLAIWCFSSCYSHLFSYTSILVRAFSSTAISPIPSTPSPQLYFHSSCLANSIPGTVTFSMFISRFFGQIESTRTVCSHTPTWVSTLLFRPSLSGSVLPPVLQSITSVTFPSLRTNKTEVTR